jgi:hypothetical protein
VVGFCEVGLGCVRVWVRVWFCVRFWVGLVWDGFG